MTDKRKRKKLLYHGIGAHTARGQRVWSQCEQILRAFLLQQHAQGVAIPEALLIIHETAGAAALHAANSIAREEKYRD